MGRETGVLPRVYNLCSGGWSPYIDSKCFSSLFFKRCNSKHLCAPHGARIHRPKCIWPTENCEKNGYHFMKNCIASTHQPAHRKICLTLIMCIDMHFHSIFSLSTFYTSKHIFIDFVVLLHWTTQQSKSASLRSGLTWQSLKKKKKKKKHSKVAKLVWLAAVQLFYFCLSFFFSYNPNKEKREEKGPKAFFEKEWPKLMFVVMLSQKLNRRCPRSARLKGYSCKLMLLFCTFTIIHPACLLPPPANQVA